MNDSRHLKNMPIQWSDLLRVYERADVFMTWVAGAVKRTNPPVPPGVYNQSSISDIVDEYRGMQTMGRCYTRTSFEAKLTG